MKEPTALELIWETTQAIREYGDEEQAEFLRGAAESMYGWDLDCECPAYVAGHRAAEAFKVGP